MKISLPVVAAFLWLAAFFLSFTWFTPLENEFFMGMMVLLFAALAVNDASGIAKREWRYPVSPILVAGGLFWICVAISMALSPILFVSWIYFFFFSVLPFTIIFFLIGDNFEKRFEDAWTGIRAILAGVSLYAIYQYFFLPDYLFKGRVQEPLADANSLAAVFSLGIFLLGGNILKAGREAKRLDMACLFLMLAGFFTTGSRAAFLAMLIMGIIFILTVGVRRISRHSWMAMIGIGIAALVLIGVVYTPGFYSGPLKVLQYSSGLHLHDVLGEREMIWATAVSMIKAHPWFGTGPGTFSFYYGEVKNILDTTAGYTVHNDPLQFAVELGILTPILFYMICIMACMRTIKAVRKLNADDRQRFDILIPFFALAACVLHSHLTANFHVLPCLMLIGFAFSLWYYAIAKALGENFRVIVAPLWMDDLSLKTLLLFVGFTLSVLIAAPLYSQRLAIGAMADLEEGKLGEFVGKANDADTYSAGNNSSVLTLAAGIPLGILEQPKNTVTEKDREDFITQIHSLLDRAERANPRNADVFWMKGRMAAIDGSGAEQEEYLKQAIRINPAHMSARLALADYLEQNNRLEEATDMMVAGEDARYSPKDVARYIDYIMRAEHMKAQLKKQKKAKGRKVP